MKRSSLSTAAPAPPYTRPAPHPRADISCAQCGRHFRGVTAADQIMKHLADYTATGQHRA